MLVVAGLSLKNLEPRVWDPASPHYIPELRAVMVSYAELHRSPARRRAALEVGLRAWLGVPDGVRVYLDNGAFSLGRTGEVAPEAEYRAFVRAARPDWWPIPRDDIPTPDMPPAAQRACVARTLAQNQAHAGDGSVPVIHVGALMDVYLDAFRACPALLAQPAVGVGGIVPNLLRAPKALPYREVLAGVRRARAVLRRQALHLFGVGGTATLHLAALLGMQSVDSSGWRNRAARGLVQLPGTGERMVAELGSWRGRTPSAAEWAQLAACGCPACRADGPEGLRAGQLAGFRHRATHNLWTLLGEAAEVERRLDDGSYHAWYPTHVDNTIYRVLIDEAARLACNPSGAGSDQTSMP